MNKCGMEGCNCQVAQGQRFCSEECARNAHSASGKCQCNHADCAGK